MVQLPFRHGSTLWANGWWCALVYEACSSPQHLSALRWQTTGFQRLYQGMISIMFTVYSPMSSAHYNIAPWQSDFQLHHTAFYWRDGQPGMGVFFKCAFSLLDLFTFCLFLQLPLSHRKVLWAPLCTVGRLEDQQSTHKSTENKAGDAVTIPKKTTKKNKKQSNSAG